MSPMLITDDDTHELRAINPMQVKEIRGPRDNSVGRQAVVMLDDSVIMVRGRRDDIVYEWRRALS